MADEIARLGIEVDSKDIKNAIKRLDKLEAEAGNTEKATKKLSGAFGVLGTAISAIGVGLLTRQIIENTKAQQKAIAQVEAAIISTGNAAGFTSEELQDMASSMQKVSTFGDEAILSMQSVLLTFTKVGNETFPQASQAILDMATRLGTDLNSAAIQVGKALNDPVAGISALTRSGIQFTEEQKDVIKSLSDTGDVAGAQAVILKELETQFGGAAKAARDTFGGALDGLSNAFGDLLEADGDGLTDATAALNDLTDLLSSSEAKDAFANITTAVINLTEATANAVIATADFSSKFVKLVSGESLARPVFSEKAVEMLQLRNEAIELNKEIPRLTESIAVMVAAQAKGAEGETVISRLNAELEEAKMRLAEIQEIQSGAAPTEQTDEEEQKASRAITPFTMDDEILDGFEDDIAFLEAQNQRQFEIEQEYAEKRKKIAEEEAKAKEKATDSMWKKIGAIAGAQGKKQFQFLKDLAEGNALLAAKDSVIQAYRYGSSIGGPPVGAAFAGIAIKETADMISGLAGVSFGGGGGGGGGGAATTAAIQPQQQEAPQGLEQAPPSRRVEIVLQGDNPHSEAARSTVEAMIETMADMGIELAVIS